MEPGELVWVKGQIGQCWQTSDGRFRIIRGPYSQITLMSFVHLDPDGNRRCWSFSSRRAAMAYAEVLASNQPPLE